MSDADMRAEAAEGSDAAREEPVHVDEYFRKKPKKHGGEWKVVAAPCHFAPIADTHAHLDMLRDPGLALARAGTHDVRFVEAMVDPLSEEGVVDLEALDGWIRKAQLYIRQMSTRICGQGWHAVPRVRISIGVHPHVSKDWDDVTRKSMLVHMHDERVSAVGEIGLDYHYDLSPRDVQKRVFAEQVEMAQEAGLPVILHVREAFDDAYGIMQDVGWPSAGILLHCYTSDATEIGRWVDAGCYVAFGGAFTFKKLGHIREAARLVPLDRLLLETDSPFMTPEPFRGAECEPAHTIWTAQRVIEELLPDADGEQRIAFLEQLYDNSIGLLDRQPTEWQRSSACIAP